jgi:hypothetical protein
LAETGTLASGMEPTEGIQQVTTAFLLHALADAPAGEAGRSSEVYEHIEGRSVTRRR